jgi:hypothetical protein
MRLFASIRVAALFLRAEGPLMPGSVRDREFLGSNLTMQCN